MFLIRWYCGRCKLEFTEYAKGKHGELKPDCPQCKEHTEFEELFELETIST
jgi:hypothetical protein